MFQDKMDVGRKNNCQESNIVASNFFWQCAEWPIKPALDEPFLFTRHKLTDYITDIHRLNDEMEFLKTLDLDFSLGNKEYEPPLPMYTQGPSTEVQINQQHFSLPEEVPQQTFSLSTQQVEFHKNSFDHQQFLNNKSAGNNYGGPSLQKS